MEFNPPALITGVIFDLHSTLADQGSAAQWLEAAEGKAGVRAPDAQETIERLDSIVEFARIEDPTHQRDLSHSAHREIFTRLLSDFTEEPLSSALYETITDGWFIYDDTLPVLRALRDQGIATAILSNIAVDMDALMEQLGLHGEVDAVIASSHIGAVKPQAEAFLHAADALGLPVESLLMVGDNSIDDGAAAKVGIRSLVLPRTRGPIHGLATVLGVVAAAQTLALPSQP